MIKKLILLGFGLTLLIGLPLAIFVLQNQSQTTTSSGAAPVTKFSFTVPTGAIAVGQQVDVPIVVDPGGTNQVSFVKFAFTYDPTILDKAPTPVTIDTTTYTQLEAPNVTCTDTLCTVTATLSIGSNQSAVIKTPTTVATMHFIAKANTDANGTQLAFVNGQNQALSVGSSDQAAENVYLSGTPATIIIGGQGTNGGGGGGTDNTASGSGTDNGSLGGTGGTGNTASGLSVACSSFTANNISGNPPLVVTFTSVGASSNDTISQLVVTYGDGTSDTVASGSGIGTGSVNNQISHTYSANGTFTASIVFTTAGGATSDSTTCTQTITVGSGSATTANGPTPGVNGQLPPTGPGQTVLLIGVAGGLITILGAVALFAL